MQKLYERLKALFNLSGSKAMPGDSTIETALNGSQSYIAPDDGYVSLIDDAGGYHRISIINATLIANATTESGWGSGWFPVHKGQWVTVRYISETARVTFGKVIGGGQSLLKIIRGGELCKRLNRFSKPFLVSLLRKPISQTTLNQQVLIGLLLNSRLQGKGELHKRLVKQADQLPQLTMGGYVCKQTAHGYESRPSIARSSYQSTLRALLQQRSLLGKVGGLITSLRTQRPCQQLLACLSRQSVQSNLAIQGGTL